jgi:hypothetical protein
MPLVLEVVDAVGAKDQAEGDDGDGNLAECADDQWACSLFEEVAQVGSEADSGEGEQEGPAA